MNNIQRKFKSFLNTRSSKCIPLVTNNFGDVKFLFDSPIELVNKNNIFSVSLSDMIIPISWYMISDYFNNNKIYLTMNNIDYILTIPDGSYTSVELKNILITIFPGTFSISYTSYKNIYTFTNSTYDFTLTNILCYQELGFYNNTSYNSTNKILSSIKPIDLSGSREIYIYTNFNTKNCNNGKTSSTILDHIIIDCNNYDVLRYVNITNFSTYINENSIIEIHIKLYDDEENLINISSHWSMSIEFCEIKLDLNNYDINDYKPNIEI